MFGGINMLEAQIYINKQKKIEKYQIESEGFVTQQAAVSSLVFTPFP